MSGSTINFSTVNPLNENTAYYVNIEPGFIEDLSGNDFAGITTNTLWNFSVGDYTAPTADLTPLDNSINVQLDVVPTIVFNENIVLGTGSDYLVNEDNGTSVEFSDALANISATANTVALNQTGLTLGAHYHILIDNDAIEDQAGNAFAGISDTTAWSFTATSVDGLMELAMDQYSWNGKELLIKVPYSSGEVMDATGRNVRKLDSKLTVLDNLPAGIYTVRVKQNSTPSFFRIYVD